MSFVRLGIIEEILPLRSAVLRRGLAPELCINPGDDTPGNFHVVLESEGVIAGAGTFIQENLPDYSGLGYRLRGMGVYPEFQGSGYGKKILRFGMQHCLNYHADYLWFNARKVAYGFYTGMGFKIISEEFEIEGIGPHKVMILNPLKMN